MTIEVQPDPDNRGGFTLAVDGTPQSYVDVDDPGHLMFEYVRRMSHVCDLLPVGGPITAVHLGAGALTLARYIEHTRPGSRQQAIELSRDVIDLVRTQLPIPKRMSLKIRCADARDAATVLPAGLRGAVDVLVVDVFEGARTPAALTTVEFFASLTPLLAGSAVVMVNCADGAGLEFARAQVATLTEVFGQCCVIAEAAVLKGRRFGNLVLCSGLGDDAFGYVRRRCAGDPFPATVLDASESLRFCAGRVPVTAASAADSPAPPRSLFGNSGRAAR